jgi:hypothetical protein
MRHGLKAKSARFGGPAARLCSGGGLLEWSAALAWSAERSKWFGTGLKMVKDRLGAVADFSYWQW